MISKRPDETIPTKERIFNAAVKLFSEKGYAETSMRDIADMVGVTVAGLYNHYTSKEDILYSLYDFYSKHWKDVCFDNDELLALAETGTPYDVFGSLAFHFDPALQDSMDRIVKIAVRQMGVNSRSEALIKDHIGSTEIVGKILNRLIELKKIEPIDVESFASILAMFNISSAIVNGTSLELSLEIWKKSFGVLFSLIKVKPRRGRKPKKQERT